MSSRVNQNGLSLMPLRELGFVLLGITKFGTMALSPFFVIIFACVSTVQGQQFDGFTFPHELLGLSDGCFSIVNRTVSSCPAWLPRYAGLEYVHQVVHRASTILTKFNIVKQALRFFPASSSLRCVRAPVRMTCKVYEVPSWEHAHRLPMSWFRTILPTQVSPREDICPGASDDSKSRRHNLTAFDLQQLSWWTVSSTRPVCHV